MSNACRSLLLFSLSHSDTSSYVARSSLYSPAFPSSKRLVRVLTITFTLVACQRDYMASPYQTWASPLISVPQRFLTLPTGFLNDRHDRASYERESSLSTTVVIIVEVDREPGAGYTLTLTRRTSPTLVRTLSQSILNLQADLFEIVASPASSTSTIAALLCRTGEYVSQGALSCLVGEKP